MKFDILNSLQSSDHLLYITTSSDYIVEEISGPIQSVLGYLPSDIIGTTYSVDYEQGSTYTRKSKKEQNIQFKCILKTKLENHGYLYIEKPIPNSSQNGSVPLPSFTLTIPNNAHTDNHTQHSNHTQQSQNYDILYHLDSEIRNPLSGIDSTTQLLLNSLEMLQTQSQSDIYNSTSSNNGCTCGKATNSGNNLSQFYTVLEQVTEDVEYMMYCAKYIRSILSNQIDLPRLKSGAIHLQPSNVYLAKDIISPIMMMLYSQKSENVRVDIDCDDSLRINADSYRLSQLLESLLGVYDMYVYMMCYMYYKLLLLVLYVYP